MESIKLPDLIPYRKNRLWGYSNNQKNIIIECKFDYVDFFSDGVAKVRCGQDWSLIDVRGNFITRYFYSKILDFHDGLAPVKRGDKWGFINNFGVEIIHCKYAKAFPFFEGLARVKSDETYKWGFIDKHQNVIIDFDYNEGSDFKNGIAKVRLNYSWGLINKFGIVISPCIYQEIDAFKNNLAIVRKKVGDYFFSGVIDINGGEIVPCKERVYIEISDYISYDHGKIIYQYFDSGSCFRVGNVERHLKLTLDDCTIANTTENGYCEYLIAEGDLQKNPISSCYDSINPVSENVAIICRDGKRGLLNNKGEEIVFPHYEKLEKFSDDYFIAMNDEGLFGLLAYDGSLSMPSKFTFIEKFSENLFIVSSTKAEEPNSRESFKKFPFMLVYKNGQPFNHIRYGSIGRLSEEFSQLARVFKNKKLGFINQNGVEVVPCNYLGNSYKISNNLIRAEKEEGYGIVNSDGEEIIRCIYQSINLIPDQALFYVKKIVEHKNMTCHETGYVDFKGLEYWEGSSSEWTFEET